MPAYNLNALFHTTAYNDDLLRNISLTEADETAFCSARDTVRESLRAGLPRLLGDGWLPGESAARPRFIPQGSWAYGTLNAPCRPPQHADLDYGVYLPVEYANGQPPAQGARLYFDAVEKVLEPVAKQRGWELHTDNGNCVRLVIDVDKHIDVPCYVMRRKDFNQQQASNRVLAERLEAEGTAELRLELIPQSGVLRATRENGWQPDDPRPLYDWWKSALAAKGEQMRRVARYVKAARDHEEWPDDEAPKSLLLTVAVEGFFERHDRRDDLAAAAAYRRMSDHLRAGGKVENPTKPGQDLAEALDGACIRATTCDWLERIAHDLEYATGRATEPRDAVEKIHPRFGSRLPKDPERVAMDTVATARPRRAASLGLAGTVNSG